MVWARWRSQQGARIANATRPWYYIATWSACIESIRRNLRRVRSLRKGARPFCSSSRLFITGPWMPIVHTAHLSSPSLASFALLFHTWWRECERIIESPIIRACGELLSDKRSAPKLYISRADSSSIQQGPCIVQTFCDILNSTLFKRTHGLWKGRWQTLLYTYTNDHFARYQYS